MSKPAACLEIKPTRQSIMFSGEYINLCAVSRVTGLDRGYISHILSGNRDPTLSTCYRIAQALGMTATDFISCLEVHWKVKAA